MNKLMLLPALAFISENDWSQESFKDNYLEIMINAFKEIDNNENLSLIWSNKLEEILWTEPRYKPWGDLNVRNSLVPIFYKFFVKNVDFISHENVQSTSSPNLEHTNTEILDEYYSISNHLILEEIEFALFNPNYSIQFETECNQTYSPICCCSNFDILKLQLKPFLFNGSIEESKAKLTYVISLYLKKNGLIKNNTYCLSSAFMRKVQTLSDLNIIELIDRLSLRISYNGQQARECIILQDEFITTNGINEFRMRITNRPTSKRVHYVINDNVLEFLNYYGVGEHDKRL
ncbi:hypothetical protein Q4512_16210 [Oceanihabitans sp. 2_MG-2023]|uniref:hypothetical protein n=1 Tax=Oceanihabitans sp. 2_MG-2023 TaxID=3062661 RepID=UPI0026E1252D|nr:hypothetical protein [Oceanihabitans sp. 2_MG-2023]MDO6598464.1 hypothetical protein [Oceanihabitans sp. 2_MG-2023]